ncbi:AIM24 family protein [Aquisphaera insulae]|uniref:AIM24 family protein n=1 Tax=Aquisphaera insulae TaxID=2712864 RepID=UPI0013EAD60F|nr:AIM24 family protein [Aquisphaera insulae]
MANFEIEGAEGTRWVKVTLEDEEIRAEKASLSHMKGHIVMDTPLPKAHDLLVSLVSTDSPFRPRYRGTGELYLESSMGGFHLLEMHPDEDWIVENGAYWASEGSVKLSLIRERAMTAFWAGEGFFWYQTKLHGGGKVILAARGPVEEVKLDGEKLVVDGTYVIARTAGVNFTIGRPARSRWSTWMAGQTTARIYQGTGRLLMCTTPYWRLAIKDRHASDPLCVG